LVSPLGRAEKSREDHGLTSKNSVATKKKKISERKSRRPDHFLGETHVEESEGVERVDADFEVVPEKLSF